MCCTFGPARLSNTIVYCGEHQHPVYGLVHVVGYQNTVRNLMHQPNAMILPFPAKEPMGPGNIIDTSKTPNILKDMVRGLQSTYDGMREEDDSDGVKLNAAQVFTSGKYTVVLADKPSDLADAMQLVPENRRPRLNPEILAAYGVWYPKWPVAICCFDPGEMHPADPLLWWYVPTDSSKLFFPALDAHDGRRPKAQGPIRLDHTLLAGCDVHPRDLRAWHRMSGSVYYTDQAVTADMSHLLPTRVIGVEMHDKQIDWNGDFYLNVSDLRNARGNFVRQPPPAMRTHP